MKAREDASTSLINYGYTFYDTKLIVKGGSSVATAQVWKAAISKIEVGPSEDLYLTLARGEFKDIKTTVELQPRLIAPLSLNSNVGQLRIIVAGQPVQSVPLHPLKVVSAGGWWQRLIDTVRLWFA